MQMETGILTPKLISCHFLNSKKPEEIGLLFKCYADAASHEKGSKGLDYKPEKNHKVTGNVTHSQS